MLLTRSPLVKPHLNSQDPEKTTTSLVMKPPNSKRSWLISTATTVKCCFMNLKYIYNIITLTGTISPHGLPPVVFSYSAGRQKQAFNVQHHVVGVYLHNMRQGHWTPAASWSNTRKRTETATETRRPQLSKIIRSKTQVLVDLWHGHRSKPSPPHAHQQHAGSVSHSVTVHKGECAGLTDHN